MMPSRTATKPPASTPEAPESAPPPPLTTEQRAKLRAITMCDERTIKRWWARESVNRAIAFRLDFAARELGIRR